MIARKITYKGNFAPATANLIFDIVRKIEITGEVKWTSPSEMLLFLEGDPSQIKLIQHQIERRAKESIKGKEVQSIPFQNYQTITFLQN